MNFAENLKKAREGKGFSGKQLSEELSIPYPTYMAYENQGREPKYNNLIKIAEKLDVSVDELLEVKLPSKTNSLWKKAKKELEYAFSEWDTDIHIINLQNGKVKIDINLKDGSTYDLIILKSKIIEIVENTIKDINIKCNDDKIDGLYNNFLHYFANCYFENLKLQVVQLISKKDTKYINFIDSFFKKNEKLNYCDANKDEELKELVENLCEQFGKITPKEKILSAEEDNDIEKEIEGYRKELEAEKGRKRSSLKSLKEKKSS